MNFKTRLTTAIATGAVLLNALAPVTYAGNQIVISGNGAGSDNTATVTQNTTSNVSQNNVANVTNTVNADARTGGNDANFNTGGNVTVGTGNANVTVNVSNDLNRNVASVNCCQAGNTTVNISENGAFTNNTANLTQSNTTSVDQLNAANVNNNVDADARTGGNDAGYNTGGDVVIVTGNATVNASVSTKANTNVARVGSSVGAGVGTGVSLLILDNGAGSDNTINANLSKVTALGQNNVANVNNNVDADARTGGNDANFNTGDGDVIIATGDAKVNAAVDNAVNFNWADVDCGCVYDLTAKIDGNGAAGELQSDNDNVILANLSSLQLLGQVNAANSNNLLEDLDARTGRNEASMNTAGSDSDPAVVTGNATVNAGASNSGNKNVIGSLPSLPSLPNVELQLNWSVFWAIFGLSL
jgi:hypothetical protein